jgi:hypothetical protein
MTSKKDLPGFASLTSYLVVFIVRNILVGEMF